MVWERVLVFLNSIVCGFYISCFKRRLSNYQSVNYHSEGPDVDLVRVTLFTFKHFWCDVVRSTTDGSLALSIELELGGKTKVTDFDFHLVV